MTQSSDFPGATPSAEPHAAGWAWLRPNTIRGKFLAFVVPIVLVSTVVVFGFFELNARRAAEQQLDTKLARLLQIQSAVVSESLWNVADQQIKLILTAVLTDQDVVAAAVYDERGELVSQVGDDKALTPHPYFAQTSIMYADDESPIEIGQLAIALTDARLSDLARERLILASVLATILLLSVIGAALVANRRTIGRPLNLMLESIRQSRSDGPRRRVDWSSNDEIGRVVTAFNDMQQRQDAIEASLRSSRDELENRVAERTSELAAAQEQAQIAQMQLADAIETISEGFALFNTHDQLVVANRRYREIMFGDGNADITDDIKFSALVRRAAKSGQFPDATNDIDRWMLKITEHHRAADEPFIEETAGNHWHQISNRHTGEGGTVAVLSDITEIKRISDELRRAKDTAEAANEAKSSFLATMSHEIRTPLNGLLGMSNLLSGTQLTAEQRDYCKTMASAADTLLTVINDILDFSKVEAGALELERTPIDLVENVEESVELMGTKAAEKQIELNCRIDNSVPAGVYGDPVRLKQIVLNLLNNAVKFTDAGEVTLDVSAKTANPSPEPGDATLLKFVVRDTGIGIPADRMDRLFRSFSQVDASTTRRFGGTGLGLVITKRLVELMGGEISVESELGVGTAFTFTVPAEVAELPDRSTRAAALDSIRQRAMLIVDDNRTNRLILEEKLRSWEVQTESTGDPRQALEWIRSGRQFDACIIDYKMPEMNGLELARQITSGQLSAVPKLILFSSISLVDPSFREQATQAGITSILTKPARSGHLLNVLAESLAANGTDRLQDQPVADTSDAGSLINTLSILVVDDNAINRKVASKILKRLGCESEVVDSGINGVDQSVNGTFDVVLMDIEMPEMDGVTAANLIREQMSADVRPYIVALTANAMASERESYLTAGMDDYLSKPIDIPELVRCLNSAHSFRQNQQNSGTQITNSNPV